PSVLLRAARLHRDLPLGARARARPRASRHTIGRALQPRDRRRRPSRRCRRDGHAEPIPRPARTRARGRDQRARSRRRGARGRHVEPPRSAERGARPPAAPRLLRRRADTRRTQPARRLQRRARRGLALAARHL
ncbi:MAG: Cryptic sugar kinase Mak, partial [uncultured Friedmanniella sp.]